MKCTAVMSPSYMFFTPSIFSIFAMPSSVSDTAWCFSSRR